jgi:hypothetical protein
MLTGHCLCGEVRFQISEPLVSASYCHCTRCQRRSGAGASVNARLAPGSLQILEGAEKVREWRPPGEGHVKAFCGECGAGLYSRHPDDPSKMGIRLGTIDGDPGIRPSLRHHTATAAVWEPIPEDGLPRHPDRPA